MKNTYRLTWIELLRILFMIMVLILHINLCGGIFHNVPFGGVQYLAVWLLEALCFCAVNGYAMITGYVSCESRFRYCKIVPIWLQVVFWCVVITAAFAVFVPDKINSADILRAFIPVSENTYWYFTAYFGMFFFIPFFNILIGQLDFKKYTVLILTLFVLLSVYSDAFKFVKDKDIFSLKYGYSMLWLSALYFMGAYIKRFGSEIKLKKRTWAAIYFISSAVFAINTYFIEIDNADSFDIIGKYYQGGYTMEYNSPFCVISAFSLIMLFKDKKINSRKIESVIKFFSASSFGIFLIHTHPLVFNNIISDLFIPMTKLNVPLLIISIIGAAIAAYIVLALAEQLRISLFRLIKVRELTFAAADKISNALQRIRLK